MDISLHMSNPQKLSNDIYHDIATELEDIKNSRGKPGSIIPLKMIKPVADDTLKLQIRDHKNRIFAFVLCSTEVEPNLVAKGINKAAAIRNALTPELASTVIKPILDGELDGLTYAVLPYYKPVSQSKPLNYLQRKYLSHRVLNWLRKVTSTTISVPESDEIQSGFFEPLNHLTNNQLLCEDIRKAATLSLNRLESNQWQPRFVLAHNDFWVDNLLLNRGKDDNPHGFIIIDWPDAEIKGYPIYDLLRMVDSLRLNKRRMCEELKKHCQMLDCAIIDASSYLLTSLGFLGMNLGYFPEKQYIRLVDTNYRLLKSLQP